MIYKMLSRDPKDEILKAHCCCYIDETRLSSYPQRICRVRVWPMRGFRRWLMRLTGDGEMNEDEFLRFTKKAIIFWALSIDSLKLLWPGAFGGRSQCFFLRRVRMRCPDVWLLLAMTHSKKISRWLRFSCATLCWGFFLIVFAKCKKKKHFSSRFFYSISYCFYYYY